MFKNIFLLLCLSSNLFAITISVNDSVAIEGYPEIGKWMINNQNKPANWLGMSFYKQTLIEPINIIIIDRVSKTEEESIKRIRLACDKAGFSALPLHTDGYKSKINNSIYAQFPATGNLAYSDAPAWENNNHGRIFGMSKFKNYFIASASFSREAFALTPEVGHHFLSFTEARDTFTNQMNLRSEFYLFDRIDLKNRIEIDELYTTGDHDGLAVVLSN